MTVLSPDKKLDVQLPDSTNKEGPDFPDVNDYGPQNTDENLQVLLNFLGIGARFNMMTYEPEIFNSLTDTQLSKSPDQIRSWLRSHAVRHGLNKAIVDDHLLAIAERHRYHPMAHYLESGKWDGVPRIEKVLRCLNAKNNKLALVALKRWLVGIVASLYEPNFKSKLVPILLGEQSYCKTAYVERIAKMLPNSFLEGAELNPDNKDSVLSCLRASIVELGEFERTNKNSPAALKAFLSKNTDTVRPPYARLDIKKPRQTHFIATVNKRHIYNDETGSSRFVVLEMNQRADMETLNSTLGWQYNPTGALNLANPDLLKQFWLEVKHLYDSGHGWHLTAEELAIAAEINEQHNDNSSEYDYIKGAYIFNSGNSKLNNWVNAAQLVNSDPKLNASKTTVIGKALTQLCKEGLLEKKKCSGNQVLYRMVQMPSSYAIK